MPFVVKKEKSNSLVILGNFQNPYPPSNIQHQASYFGTIVDICLAMKRFLFLFLLTCSVIGNAQQWQSERWGVQVQLIAAIGTHRTSVGIRLNSYINASYAQLNLGTMYRFHAHNLGGRMNFGEWRHSAGLVLMAGRETNPVNFLWDGAFHQTARPYSVGYAYLLYVDKAGTTQRSGVFNIGIQRVDILFENDVWGGQGKDRFRTGDFQVSYRTATERVAMGLRLWTGETKHSVWNREPQDGMPGGYRDLTPLPFGKTSHGIFFVGGSRAFFGGQVARIEAGFDSEQIRHLFQNKISHDLIWMPKKFPRTTPHYPRLGTDGQNVFFRKDKRPDHFYFSESVNDGVTY